VIETYQARVSQNIAPEHIDIFSAVESNRLQFADNPRRR
jgi:hypothetical protein